MSRLNFCFVVLAVATCVLRSSKASEPVCSQFDNDKKLMEYMIETRQEVKKMANDLRRTEEYLLAVLEHRKVEMQHLSDDLKDKLEKGMQNITDKVTSLNGRVGIVELPALAFSAYNPKDKTLSSKEVIILQSVLINEGNGYDNETGKFTAHINGIYHFTAHVCNKVDAVIHYAIVLNDEWIARSQQFEENDVNPKYGSCSSVSALTRMKPGDKIWIMCTAGGGQEQIYDDSHRRNSFIGFLLHK